MITKMDYEIRKNEALCNYFCSVLSDTIKFHGGLQDKDFDFIRKTDSLEMFLYALSKSDSKDKNNRMVVKEARKLFPEEFI